MAVDFGEVVHATDPEEDLELNPSPSAGTRARRSWPTAAAPTTLTFAYVVQSDDEDDDGISVGPTALAGRHPPGCGRQPGGSELRRADGTTATTRSTVISFRH